MQTTFYLKNAAHIGIYEIPAGNPIATLITPDGIDQGAIINALSRGFVTTEAPKDPPAPIIVHAPNHPLRPAPVVPAMPVLATPAAAADPAPAVKPPTSAVATPAEVKAPPSPAQPDPKTVVQGK